MSRSAMPRRASAARAAGILLITATILSPAGAEAAAGGIPPPGAAGQRAPAGPTGALASKRPRRVLDQAVLTLSPPQLPAPLISGVKATIQPLARYNGAGILSYQLLEGPDSMILDASSGILRWTPPAAAEGTSPAVRVSAGDGQASAETSFTVPVAASSLVASTLSGVTLTITQGTLQGVGFTFPAETSRPPAELAAATVPAGQAPPLPPDVIRVSDFFRVTPVEAADGSMITVALPRRLVPAGRASHELRLFVFTDRVDGTDGPVWVCTWRERDVLPGGTATLKIKDLGELSFVGVPASPVTALAAGFAAVPHVLRSEAANGMQAVTITCQQKLLADGTHDPSTQHCVVASEPPFEVWIKDFPRHQWVPRATVQDLVGWLVAARAKFAGLHLVSEPVFEVDVENIPDPTWLGFVASIEDYFTLHLDEEARRTRDKMQCATVHEYFHHAQSRTRIAGLGNVVADGARPTHWLIEGTARWFEDEVFDGLDSYRSFNGQPLPAILVPGLAAEQLLPPASEPWRDPYHRFAFFKLLYNRCPGFDLPSILNANLADDPSGIKRFRAQVETWQCDFDAGFDASVVYRRKLASALLLYTWATLGRNDLSILDPNESPYNFELATQLTPSAACIDATTCPPGARAAGVLPPISVSAVPVLAVDPLPPNNEVVIEVDNGNLTAWSWLWIGAPSGAIDVRKREFFRGSVRWGSWPQPRTPEMMVIAVNQFQQGNAPFEVRARLLNRAPKTAAVQVDVEYPDRGLKFPTSVLRWHLTAQATLTGMEAMQFTRLGVADPASPSINRVTVKSSGLTPPYTVTLAGTLDVVPIPSAGSYRPPGASLTTHWQFFEKRYKTNCNTWEMSTEPGFNLTVTVAPGAGPGSEQFSAGPCVLWTWGTWKTDDQGNISDNWGYSFSSFGELRLELNQWEP
jgi:hypothetical protein